MARNGRKMAIYLFWSIFVSVKFIASPFTYLFLDCFDWSNGWLQSTKYKHPTSNTPMIWKTNKQHSRLTVLRSLTNIWETSLNCLIFYWVIIDQKWFDWQPRYWKFQFQTPKTRNSCCENIILFRVKMLVARKIDSS